MWISKSVCLFIIYSMMGWVYETLYCTIKGGKWENRGFLYGPVCPIYGTGALAIAGLLHIAEGYDLSPNMWEIFLIAVGGSACLEYATSWVLEKTFHAVWWDYSDFPFNLHGRISLFSSLGFGFGGLLVVYRIAPFTESLIRPLPPVVAEFLALIFVFILSVDITLTVTVLLNFDRMVIRIENSFNQNMDSLVDGAVNKTWQIRRGIAGARNRVDIHLHSMSDLAKKAIRRASAFRDSDKNIETVKNLLLSAVRQASGKGKAQENDACNNGE